MKRYLFTLVLLPVLSLWANAQSQGFFLDNWEPKSISITDYIDVPKPSDPATAVVNIDAGNKITKVSKYLFGNNANVYMSQMVDQPQLLENIKNLSPNLIRFPGGNLSNLYFWDMEVDQYYDDLPAELIDGIDGSVDPASYWSGKNTAGWTCSLDNYYNMLDSTGQTGMITVNYSYARYGLSDDPVAVAAKYAADWVRYDNGRTKYWEIGNENSGTWQSGYRINTATNKDGQPDTINGGIYGQHFLVFVKAMREAAAEIGHKIYIGAQLIQYEAINSWNPPEDDWNELYFSAAGNAADFYIVHSYYTPYNQDSPVEVILNTPVSETKNMMDWMKETTSRAGVDLKPIALTEWNIFAVGSMQAVSHINGMHASMTLGELIKNKYGQASRWDLANSWNNGDDHGMFNQGDEPGNVPKWNPRPDFYHLYYFQKYFGDQALVSQSAGKSDIISYASRFSSGQTAVVLANKGRTDEVVKLSFNDFSPGTRYYWYTIEGGDDNGDFSRKVFINGEGTEYDAGGPSNYQTIAARSATSEGGVKVLAPALSVTHVIIDEGFQGMNNPPIAAISASEVSGEIAFSVDFSAEGSSDPDGDDLEYLWDFGDGTNATGLNVSHTYITADTYIVTVTVYDGTNIDQAFIDISAEATGATCKHATVNTLPITQKGGGEHCWVVDGTINSVNSWGMWAVVINGEYFTNKFTEQVPDKINGKYYIYLNAGEDWANVEIDGENSSGTTYMLTTRAIGQGTISPASGEYAENTTLNIKATPAQGWTFLKWSGDASGDANPTSIKMNSDKSVTATFIQGPPPMYTIHVLVTGEGSVIRNPDQEKYNKNDVVTLTANPAEGYIFGGWTGDTLSSDNPLSVLITGDMKLTANFVAESTPVYSLVVTLDGPGKVNGIPSATDSIAQGTVINLTAVPDEGAKFDRWSGGAVGSANTISITMKSNVEVTAHFSNIIYYTLSTSTDGNGKIELDPDGGKYQEGTLVTVEAIPNSNYVFASWSGDLTGFTNPATITMDSDKDIFASFIEGSTPCENPAVATLPVSQDGVGAYCFKITEDIAYVNSWNTAKVTINNVDYTNIWSNSFPDKIDGAYYVYYEGEYTWSHFEASSTKSAGSSGMLAEVYPNPFSETFILRLDNPETAISISILDQSGRLIRKIGKDRISAEMLLGENLEAGFYILRVNTTEGSNVYKITKN